MIHEGDCIQVMQGMDADSVDAIVTDPPYGLEFMGKEWDNLAKIPERNDRWSKNWGGYGWHGGKRTDPQAMQAWNERWGREALRVTKPGGYLLAFGGTRTHHRLVCGLEDAGWIIRDELDWIYASGFPKGKANLKPAHEPIVLARKPGPLRPLAIDECRIGTFAEGEYPTRTTKIGGSNNNQANARGPDGKPIYYDLGPPPSGRWPSNVLLSDPALFDVKNEDVVGSGAVTERWFRAPVETPKQSGFGIWSREGSVNNYDDEGGYSRFFIVPKADRADREPVVRGQLAVQPTGMMQDDSYKWDYDGKGNKINLATKRENAHPTVKPVDLMRHLVRLVTPTGGTVLDCFLGSGSTALAAELEGFGWIGIEKEAEYVKIAEARLHYTQKGMGL